MHTDSTDPTVPSPAAAPNGAAMPSATSGPASDTSITTPADAPPAIPSDSASEPDTIHIEVTPLGLQSFTRQNMNVQQGVSELVDNAIAAALPDTMAEIQVILAPGSVPGCIELIIADWGKGMTRDGLANAFNIGSAPDGDSRLHEHGVGLNNALCVLTGGKAPWDLAAKQPDGSYCVVSGPLALTMSVRTVRGLSEVLPGVPFAKPDPSIVIRVAVPEAGIHAMLHDRTAGGCDLAVLYDYLREHLGITYRGYLDLDPATMAPSARILLTAGTRQAYVPSIPVPITNETVKYLDVQLGDDIVTVEYRFGQLDTDKRDRLIATSEGTFPTKHHYLGNMETQGMDVRVGGRVLATAQFEGIFRTEKGDLMVRHPSLNGSCGEINVPEQLRGVLPTLNNKTGFDASDPGWRNLFDSVSKFPPYKKKSDSTEKCLTEKWTQTLKAAHPSHTITTEYTVWGAGTRVDVMDDGDGNLEIYEMKTDKAKPLNLYQLKMYWDGLVLEGKQPTCGTLLVKSYNSAIAEMAAKMNLMPPPLMPDGTPSKPYNFHIATHVEKHLGKTL